MVSTTFNPVNDILIAIGFVVTVIVASRNQIPRQTVKDLQSLVTAQETRIKVLEDGRLRDTETIGTLKGQVQTYKELPLQELAKGILEVSESNKQILATLQNSAEINAQDRKALAP